MRPCVCCLLLLNYIIALSLSSVFFCTVKVETGDWDDSNPFTQDEAAISRYTIQELKEAIAAEGGSCEDCLEKRELQSRLLDLVQGTPPVMPEVSSMPSVLAALRTVPQALTAKPRMRNKGRIGAKREAISRGEGGGGGDANGHDEKKSDDDEVDSYGVRLGLHVLRGLISITTGSAATQRALGVGGACGMVMAVLKCRPSNAELVAAIIGAVCVLCRHSSDKRTSDEANIAEFVRHNIFEGVVAL